jgi:hypothetical protein
MCLIQEVSDCRLDVKSRFRFCERNGGLVGGKSHVYQFGDSFGLWVGQVWRIISDFYTVLNNWLRYFADFRYWLSEKTQYVIVCVSR